MDSQAQARMVELLETDPDFYVPIKRLWMTLREEGFAIDQDEFQRMLQEDKRFEIAPGVDHGAGSVADPQLTEEMENLGFYSGPRIKLASREMTVEAIFEGMLRSLTRMNQALQSAWETRPSEDQETEDQLLEILAAGQRLECEIETLVNQQNLSENPSDL